ncbi:Transcriptional regulatory protein WalR [anaerobic digester metagenome]|jgi:two-component system phosphate regulon response regulator PhoB|nr:response regulator [Tenuifilaceae bacterium]HQB79490.1 response regulator [Tenuifilaceae bacterium]
MGVEANKTILLVDDDIDYLFQIKFQLERFGFKVVTAESQKEAEQLLANLKPDLAILDLMMENDDSGFILSYKMKKKYPDVPIIIATAVSSETGMSFGISSEEERKWIRADLYLEKGIRPEQLHKDILKLLNL